MQKVRDGGLETLGVLYERHRTRLLNFFVRLTGDEHLSEDLVHEVFLRMLKYRHTFADRSRFTGWMYQVARNVHFDCWRKRRNEVPLESAEPDGREVFPSPEPAPDLTVNAHEEAGLLQQALSALPVELREVLVLSRFEHLRYEEMAEVLNCTVGAVKMRMHRGLKELKETFTKIAKAKVL